MCNRRKYPMLAALFFAAVPACLLGLVVAVLSHPIFGIICGAGMFGFGMDMLLNGSDRRKHTRFEDLQ